MAAIARMRSVVLDCPDPQALATFYSELLDWKITSVEDDWVVVEGAGYTRLAFQLAPDHQPPQWPDPSRPQQFHLDVTVDDIDEAEPRTLALGATKLEYQPGSDFRVYADPAGHPFCLCWDID